MIESGADIEAAVGAFNESRPRLFGIAYRMLGSVAEAEDIVQEAWVRWQGADRTVVRNPAGFLTTVTTRLAINTAESARVRREQYVGPWLPEPVDTSADPSLGAEKAEALESAVLMLLEKVRPDQRAAYVLREAFDYSYDEVAEILETSTANARQLVSRAKKAVRSDRKEPVDPARHRSAARSVRRRRAERRARSGSSRCCPRTSSVRRTVPAIAPRAARRPVFGRDNVARFIVGWSDWWEGTTLSWVETNGRALGARPTRRRPRRPPQRQHLGLRHRPAHVGDGTRQAHPPPRVASGEPRSVSQPARTHRSVERRSDQPPPHRNPREVPPMKVVVIGGTGLIGSKVVEKLNAHGHHAVPAAPRTGVNILTGEGLDDALAGADVVVDVSNSPSFADDDVMSLLRHRDHQHPRGREEGRCQAPRRPLRRRHGDACPTAGTCAPRPRRKTSSGGPASRTRSCGRLSSSSSPRRSRTRP